MTKDHDPQLVGDILKQAGQGDIPNLFAGMLPHIRPVAQPIKPLSRVQTRLLEPCPEHDNEICFQHSVLCQIGLPYRDPGDDVQKWEREQGAASLLIKAGEARNLTTREWVRVGLPWGAKPRLILAHLNAEALRSDSPEIAISTLSALESVPWGMDSNSRELCAFSYRLHVPLLLASEGDPIMPSRLRNEHREL
jgi:hypothetical protein